VTAVGVIAIVGATGTGKSALADALAARLGGEVVNADSMQVYRGMNIGTAKLPVAERSVPYHCIDLVDPGEPFTAALYQRAARAAIEGLRARNVTPVLCGGTGLYLRAALDNFCFDEDRVDEGCTDEGRADEGRVDVAGELRARLTEQAEQLGPEAFHALLAERDPQSAALIHPHNLRRSIRAFELIEQGTSYARQHEGFASFSSVYPTRFIGLAVEPAVLYAGIEHRVDEMMARGLLQEVRTLLEGGFRKAATAQQAIGYKELVPVIEERHPLEEAVAEIKQATRRYAKRQRTWFKRDKRIEWLDITDLHHAILATTLTPSDFTQTLLQRTLALLSLATGKHLKVEQG
jgi:tRNA dimethylallyltransferase